MQAGPAGTWWRLRVGVAGMWLAVCGCGAAGTVTLQTGVLGPVPAVLGCNAGHHFPGGNTLDWWRYAGVNGARVFISPTDIEPSDDLAPVGDGVTGESGFMARRAALRADPLNPQFINWGVFEGNFANRDLHPVNHLRVNHALGELRSRGIEACAQVTAGASRFPLGGAGDWAGQWELWQHYYAHAFHLARHFDVGRYQMYNEPDLAGVAEADYLLRLRVCADAVQCAVADVNARYGKSLVAGMRAPVNAGNASSDYAGGLGGAAVANRHVTVTGAVDPLYQAVHGYDYHQYDGTPARFAETLAELHGLLAADLAPAPRWPTIISEFNVHTGANFDAMPETLDTPVKYARLGAILQRLAAEGIGEMYLFKFSQTVRTGGTYPVAKNALHYVDNANAPYRIGGITQGGEVWRLFCEASRPGRQRLAVAKDSGAAVLDVQATLDPASGARFIYCVNNTADAEPVTFDFGAWGVQPGARVMIEEVGAGCRGGVAAWTSVAADRRLARPIGAYTVCLLTLPATAPATEETVAVAGDATVRDATHKNANFGGAAVLEVRNDPTNSSNRRAALLRFALPPLYPPDLLAVALAADVGTLGAVAECQAFVHGLDSDGWSESAVTWANAPNLRDNVAAGATIARAVAEGGGVDAHVQGQWLAATPVPAEQALDVTDFVRGQADRVASFLIVQDPRWDVELPSLASGDQQPDGLAIGAREGGGGARLRLLRKLDGDGDRLSDEAETSIFGTSPVLADTDGDGVTDGTEVLVDGTDPLDMAALPVAREANVRGGSSAGSDVDEAAFGYLMVKHSADLSFARKAYFQFDVPAAGVDADGPATFTIGFTHSFPQRVRLWGLTGAYDGFNAAVTWNTAQANETTSNSMVAAAAAPVGAAEFVDPGSTVPRPPRQFVIPRLGDFLRNGRVTLALCGEADGANDAGGLRIAPGSATLRCRLAPVRPFTAWQQGHFGAAWQDPAVAGEAEDPDGDELPNLLEYALLGDPLAARRDGVAPVLAATSAGYELRFVRDPARDDIEVVVQVADSLAGGWTNAAASVGGAAFVALLGGVTVGETVAGAVRQVVFGESAVGRRFVRLRVARMEP